MAESATFMSGATSFSSQGNSTASPRAEPGEAFVSDQIVFTPRSYSAPSSTSPSSPSFSPQKMGILSPQIGTTSGDLDINSTPPCSVAGMRSPSPFPLGLDSPPASRLRGSPDPSTTDRSIKTLEQKRKEAVSLAYVWPTEHRPAIQHDEFTDIEIPTIDLTCLISKDPVARKQVVAQVRAACLNWGFFHAVNHGIPHELLERVQKQAQRFFAMPKEEKLKVERDPKGYTGYGNAGVKPTDSQPWSEGFYLANDSSVDKYSQVLWPHGDNEDFGNSYREYNEKAENLAAQLMDLIIESLEVNADHFQPYLHNASGLLRWNHYPPCPQPHKSLGMAPHTDFNMLTVLHQGDIGGLQVQKDGKWVAVRPNGDALAINIGDTLQVLTNALYKSIPHRAVVNRTQTRISLAYFYAPTTKSEIVPSPELLERTNQSSIYKRFTMEEYLAVKKGQLLNTLQHFTLEPLTQSLAFPVHTE
ncbi:hypothetical protein M758_5G014100 [Ceratodon purpureus]|uniref:Fe2OG dioxygenase domain-containing protein n=1 Tax=Ceratodon purpureus TaxID=3225 RepID=A0A8T0HWR8_CERPU|nr:hypothetical protein KC19_5G012500 [Ceratodon purpureus]KAG0615100.1 hypothetical protein M758_5G014100 [Ceratodon purpureus]